MGFESEDRKRLKRVEDLLIGIGERLDSLLTLVVTQGAIDMSLHDDLKAALDETQALVEQNTDVVQSAELLIDRLLGMLDSAITAGDIAQVQAIRDLVAQQKTELANKVAASTPAAPTS